MGKTSLAKAIAGHMGYNICILSLNGIDSDKDLLTMCGGIPDNVVLLIEDVDAYNVNREGNNEGITLSGLLNAVDGVTAKNGCVTIMTTNHPDRLDKALIRKGRTDVHLELADPTEEQLTELFNRFGRDYNDEEFENMAAAQDYLLNDDANRTTDQFYASYIGA
jgi:chaperone BCS1